MTPPVDVIVDVISAMRSNPSVRTFTDEPVPDETVHRILDSARFAPSGGNQQPWRVIVVKDPSIRLALRDAVSEVWTEYMAQASAGHRPFAVGPDGRFHGHPIDLADARTRPVSGPLVESMLTCPVAMVIAVNITSLSMMDIDLDRECIVGGASIYPFCQNILLAAKAEGLGSLLATFVARKEEALKPILGLPQEFALAALIVAGHPATVVTKLKRRPVEAFATIDRFDGPTLDGQTNRSSQS
jgi:nitroreductase